MTETPVLPGGRPSTGDRPTSDPAAWTEYLAAARQLDTVRRNAATAAGEQARSVQLAREELTAVRARLVTQQARLRDRGVPAMSLLPSPPELTEAARSMAAGPSAVLVALQAAGTCADAADAVLAARGLLRPAGWPSWLRWLLSYESLALLVPVLQLVAITTGGTGVWSAVAVLSGLPVLAVAFAARRIGASHLTGAQADSRLDPAARFPAVVWAVPAVLTTAGIIVAMLVGRVSAG